MNIKKTIGYLCLGLLLMAFFACQKKDPNAGVVEEPAIIGEIDTPVYSEADGRATLTTLKDGTKVVCLNRKSPQVQLSGPDGTENPSPEAPQYYKIRIPENGEIGWVTTSSLGFKEDEPKDAFVTSTTWLYGKLNSGTVQLNWGDTVKYLGYKIYHDWEKFDWKDMEMWRVDAGGVEGWMIAKFLLPDVYPAVILKDADLFKLPADRSQNVEGNIKKMDIVPVIDKGTESWLTIRPPGQSKDYFISAAKGDPVSYKEVDFSVVSYLRDAYYNSIGIVDEVNNAFNSDDTDRALAQIADKKKKIDILTASKNEIDARIGDYADSSFTSELTNLAEEITEIINLLETAGKTVSSGSADKMEAEIMPLDM